MGDLLDEMVGRYAGREAIVGVDGRLTYAGWRERVREVARGLHRLGVKRGDTVALLMPNRVEWLVIDFAVTLLGATLVPISTWSRPRELEYVLNHCDASTFVTVDRYRGQEYLTALAAMGPGSARLPQLRRVVTVGAQAAGSFTRYEDVAGLGRDVGDAELDALQRAVTPGDVAYILYTSGTTSTPKGVQIQHGGLIENMWSIGERMHLGPEERMWMGISLFWGFGCERPRAGFIGSA